MTDSPYLCTNKSKLLEDMSKIALGTWAWGAGAFGGDAVFGSKTDAENLKPVFDAAMKAGLNLREHYLSSEPRRSVTSSRLPRLLGFC